MKIKLRNNREGAVLVMVLIVFVVLSILTTSIIYVSTANTRQIVAQKENMQAYYLAQSGVEIGYAALVKYNEDNKASGTELVDSINPTVTLQNQIDLTDAGGKITSITISLIANDIEISAEAYHTDSQTTAKAKMTYPTDNPFLRKWSK